jgi:hypothetical protein
VIEISGYRIRLAQCRQIHGRPEIVELADAALPPGDEQTRAAAVKSFLDIRNLRSRRVVLNIPRHLAMLKFLKLPSLDQTEIASMAKMEILRQVPYAEDEMVGAHKIIRPEDDGYSLVLLVSVLKTVVDNPVTILKSCGLTVEKIALGAELLPEWFLENLPDCKAKNVLTVNVSADYLDIQVLESGRWVFSRAVSLEDSPKNDTAWLSEVAASAGAYQKNSFVKLQGICFSGTAEDASRLEPLSEELQLPIYVVNPAKHNPITAVEKIRRDASYVTLCELCWHADDAEIDLTPGQLSQENQMAPFRRNGAIALVWLIIFLAFVIAGSWKRAANEKYLIASIDAEIERNKPRVEEAAKMAQLLETIRNHADARPLAVDIFVQAHRAVPAGMTLEMMDYEDRQSLTLRGSADRPDAVFECAKALEKSPWFSSVRVRYVTKHIVDGLETADFEIQALIGAGGENENT